MAVWLVVLGVAFTLWLLGWGVPSELKAIP